MYYSITVLGLNHMYDVRKRTLTIIGCEEGRLIDVIFHMRRLSVQSGQGGDLPIGRVDAQPVGWVRQPGVPEDKHK